MTPEQMMGMFIIKVNSFNKADSIAAKMQEACDKYNFALLHSFIPITKF